MSSGVVQDYLTNIRRSSALLEPSEEITLAREIEAGQLAEEQLATGRYTVRARVEDLREVARRGESAFERFVEANLRLVISISRTHAGRVDDARFGDIVQAGNLALITAVQRFDVAKGFKFSTYATWWIRKAISDELINQRGIRIGQRLALVMSQIAKAEADIQIDTGRPASIAEVAELMGLSPMKIALYKNQAAEPSSLNRLIEGDGCVEVGDLIPDESGAPVDQELLEHERSTAVRAAISALPRVEADILRLRFGLDGGDGLGIEDAAHRLGIDIARCRGLERIAMIKLRHPSRSQPLLACR
ncbi:sigma-70 family RNA polymerase sigma factor [Herbiconiux liukaitaii]|uniref:sigma-70 family RNA polymerase sigma factor n=1 Tax=Herbiconiux liukaitaii TaxID=3342799 RepID=UPI0035B94AA3